MERYTFLTGRAPHAAALELRHLDVQGLLQDREIALEVAEKLRERRIPCDVMVLDGRAWHTMEVRFDFHWDPERYPDPAVLSESCARWASG